MEMFFTYITEGGFISSAVLIWLSLYFILTIWIYVTRYLTLANWEKIEKSSLESLLKGTGQIKRNSILRKCINLSEEPIHKNKLGICQSVAEKKSTTYLATLSVISSTAPFIGLFGTVVSILDTFSKLGDSTTASLGVIAPAISEALVATAAGIFVAIPAYSAHVFLKRKAFELLSIIQREIDLLVSFTNAPNSHGGSKKYEY